MMKQTNRCGREIDVSNRDLVIGPWLICSKDLSQNTETLVNVNLELSFMFPLSRYNEL